MVKIVHPSRPSLNERCKGGARKSSDLPITMYFSVSAFVPLRHAAHLPLLPPVAKVSDVLAFPLAPSSTIRVLVTAKADLTSPFLSLGCYLHDSYRQQREGMPSTSPLPEQGKFISLGFPSQSSLSILNIYHFCAASFDFFRGSLFQRWMIFLTLPRQLWSRRDPRRLSKSSNSQRS